MLVHACECATGVVICVSDADCIDNRSSVLIAATPKSQTPKLHPSKLILSTASVRVRRYVCD